MTEKITPPTNIENIFDDKFKPIELNSIDKNLIDIEKEKIKLGEKFLSDDVTQKTEITNQQRIILAILDNFANKPFSISAIKCKKLKNYKIKILLDFLKMFYKLGIPINRKGRSEEVDVLKSLLSSHTPYFYDEKTHKEALIK